MGSKAWGGTQEGVNQHNRPRVSEDDKLEHHENSMNQAEYTSLFRGIKLPADVAARLID